MNTLLSEQVIRFLKQKQLLWDDITFFNNDMKTIIRLAKTAQDEEIPIQTKQFSKHLQGVVHTDFVGAEEKKFAETKQEIIERGQAVAAKVQKVCGDLAEKVEKVRALAKQFRDGLDDLEEPCRDFQTTLFQYDWAMLGFPEELQPHFFRGTELPCIPTLSWAKNQWTWSQPERTGLVDVMTEKVDLAPQ